MLDDDHQPRKSYDKNIIGYIVLYCTLLTGIILILATTLTKLTDNKRDLTTLISKSSILTTQNTNNNTPACTVTSFSVKLEKNPSVLSDTAFTLADTAAHFTPSEIKYYDAHKDSFGCIDAREDVATLGTPGGDFAELAMGLAVYFNHTGESFSRANVAHWVNTFMTYVITPDRPLYFHSDTTYMDKLLKNLSTTAGTRFTVFPSTIPPSLSPQIWLDALSAPEFQGCGHVRLILADPGGYGFTTMEDLPKILLQEIMYWFWGAVGKDKQKFDIRLMAGALQGKAVTIFSGSCNSDTDTVYPPLYHGSSVFIYTADATAVFRKDVMVKFFASRDPRVNPVTFLSDLNKIAQLQLELTLARLTAVVDLPIYSVKANILTNTPK